MTAAESLDPVPRFYLYGEQHRQVDADFLHVESLDDRSRPSEWRIRPHAHVQLNHLLHIFEGGGTLSAEGEAIRFEAPCLVLVPAGTVHGFEFDPDSRGWVVTIASDHLRQVQQRDPDLADVVRLRALPLDADASAEAESRAARLHRELGWAAPGHRAAAEAMLLDLLVRVLRAGGGTAATPARAPSRQAALVARLRERIDQRFRLREPVATHAAALNVSVSALRAACAACAGQSPTDMLDARALLEARRALLYSTLTVAEIGYALGFADPAYFSRFFARHLGQSPARYRRTASRPAASRTPASP